MQEAQYTRVVGVGFLKKNQKKRINHGLTQQQPTFSYLSIRVFFNGTEVSAIPQEKEISQLHPMFSPWMSAYSKKFLTL